MTIREIRALTGLSQAAFAKAYKIPKRTVESWEMGERRPPEYVLGLLERVVKMEVYDEKKKTERQVEGQAAQHCGGVLCHEEPHGIARAEVGRVCDPDGDQ